MRKKMADNRLFSPPGVVTMGNAPSSRISRPNLFQRPRIFYPDVPFTQTFKDSILSQASFNSSIEGKDNRYICCITAK